jgi:hypothetical protein
MIALRAPRAQGEVRPIENGSLRKARGWRRRSDERSLEAPVSFSNVRDPNVNVFVLGGIMGPFAVLGSSRTCVASKLIGGIAPPRRRRDECSSPPRCILISAAALP